MSQSTDAVPLSATLYANALQAVIRVPVGWQVTEDGWWTVIRDAEGKVEISLGVIPKQERSVAQIVDAIEAVAMQEEADTEASRQEQGGIWRLVLRNRVALGGVLERLHLLREWGDEATVLRAMVVAEAGNMRFAEEQAGLVLQSAEYGALPEVVAKPLDEFEEAREEQQTSVPGRPDWAKRAEELELEDRLEEMEALVKESVPSLHFAIALAWNYHERWVRLRESDPVRAKEARKRAAAWAYNYASYATSGGEGAALSWERDQFLKLLGPEPLD